MAHSSLDFLSQVQMYQVNSLGDHDQLKSQGELYYVI